MRSCRILPYPEKLSYRVEWRLVTAGEATLQFSRSERDWQLDLHLASAGLVSRLYGVLDTYKLTSDEHFCALRSSLDAQEGKRHSATVVEFDNARHKLSYSEKDFVKNTADKHELDVAPCTFELPGALIALRALRLEPGKTIAFPVTTGKKLVNAKVEAEAKDTVTVDGKNYSTVRYQAFVFDNVLYRRKGRLFVWMTDDGDRVPVRLQFQMGFPIGAITLDLEKREKL